MVFVINKDKVLLLKRLNTWFGNNQFAVPGGLLDNTETPEAAACRETLEETGIEISPDNLRLLKKEICKARGRIFENYYFYTSTWSGTLSNREPERHSDLNWYKITDLPKPLMPIVKSLILQLPT